MAQVNIHHVTAIKAETSSEFSKLMQAIVADVVHGVKPADIQPDTVSVWVMKVDDSASLSGADTEVQILVSGNNWPKNEAGQPLNVSEAKIHFDTIAAQILDVLQEKQDRKVYVWVTPFTATGWAS